jgi:hypothetical protein
LGVSGPSSKPQRGTGEPVFVPHPDDEAEVLDGVAAAERGDALNSEDSEAYVRRLLDDSTPSK